MTTHLLDANVLIALVVEEHEHHESAARWVRGVGSVALCPVVEGALVRYLVRVGERAEVTGQVLREMHALPGCAFWADAVSYADLDLADVRGHRQVTAAYLAGLARERGARLATFDRGLAENHHDVAVLITPS